MSEIKGIKNLMSKLDSLGGNVETTMHKAIEYCGKYVEDEAKLNCPVDIGDLRQSIQHQTINESGHVSSTVYTNSDHAAYVEFGTGKVGESTNKNSNVNVAYTQDKWLANIPGVGPRYINGQPAQPYLYPALKNNEPELKRYITGQLQKEIERLTK